MAFVNSHYVAVLNDTIIGIISLGSPREEDLSESTYELSALYIDPDYIGRGFGTIAMRWIQSEIFSRGYTAVSLWVFDKNKRAQKFYKNSVLKKTGQERIRIFRELRQKDISVLQ